MTWLHMEFVLIFITGPSKAKLGKTALQQLTLLCLQQLETFGYKQKKIMVVPNIFSRFAIKLLDARKQAKVLNFFYICQNELSLRRYRENIFARGIQGQKISHLLVLQLKTLYIRLKLLHPVQLYCKPIPCNEDWLFLCSHYHRQILFSLQRILLGKYDFPVSLYGF